MKTLLGSGRCAAEPQPALWCSRTPATWSSRCRSTLRMIAEAHGPPQAQLLGLCS